MPIFLRDACAFIYDSIALLFSFKKITNGGDKVFGGADRRLRTDSVAVLRRSLAQMLRAQQISVGVGDFVNGGVIGFDTFVNEGVIVFN